MIQCFFVKIERSTKRNGSTYKNVKVLPTFSEGETAGKVIVTGTSFLICISSVKYTLNA